MKRCKRCVSVLLVMLTLLAGITVGIVPGAVKTEAASWNGYNYGGGKLYGYQTFLQAYGIDYDVYMKWLDDHDADSDNPDYYLGTPYVGEDHRNPHGDCDGAYGYYDTPGVEAMNCTGFVWHVLYKAALHSGASQSQINRLGVMAGMPGSWYEYGVYRVYFDSLEDAYDSGILEKGDLFWIYGTSDNHNAIFYGDSPEDFIYWDSAGSQNRYATVHAAGDCLGLWVAKVTQPDKIELHIDTASGGNGSKFGTKYVVFDNKAKAQAVADHPDNDAAWDERIGTIVLDQNGHGHFRTQGAPTAGSLWNDDTPNYNHSYFSSPARRVDCDTTYYAVQWSHTPGIAADNTVHEFRDSGDRTPSGYRIYRCYAPISVKTPEFSSLKSVNKGIQLNWDSVKDAYRYCVYYKNRNGGWTRLTETSGISYIDTDVKSGTTYTYTIRCIDKYGNFISDYNRNGWSLTHNFLDTPKITQLKSTPEGVQLTWDAVKGKNFKYRLYFKNRTGWVYLGETADTTYTDTAVAKGKTYLYTLRCVDQNGNGISNYNTTGWKHTYAGVDSPKLNKAVATPDGIKLSWSKVSGVSYYRVYYKNSAGGWSKLTDTNNTEALDGKVTPGKTYTYGVRCINSKGYATSDDIKATQSATYQGVATPQISTLESTPEGVNITWEPVENAAGYRVYYKNRHGGWTKLTDTDNTTCTDHIVTKGTAYTYTIRCINSSGYPSSDFIAKGWSHTYEGVTPVLTEVTDTPDGISLKWNRIDGVSAYHIYRKPANGSWELAAKTNQPEYFDGQVIAGTDYTYALRTVNSKGYYTDGEIQNEASVTYHGVDTPQISALESTPEGVHITWEPVENATAYRVYYKNKQGGWTKMIQTTDTEYTDAQVGKGKTYVYTVRCFNNSGYPASDFNNDGWKHTYAGVKAPEFTEIRSEAEGVRMHWTPIEGVETYRVYFKNKQGGWTQMAQTKDSEYLDTEVNIGKTYYYMVHAINSEGYVTDGNDQTETKFTYRNLTTPLFSKLESTPEGIRLTWEPVDGASLYRVYYKNKQGTWTKMTETSGTEYIDNVVSVGKTYIYTVRCFNHSGKPVSNYNINGWKHTYAGSPVPQITNIHSEAKGIRMSWTPIEGVSKYRVYYKNKQGGWTQMAETAGTEYLDKEVNLGKMYYYTVRPVNSAGYCTAEADSEGWKCRFVGEEIANTGITPEEVTAEQPAA